MLEIRDLYTHSNPLGPFVAQEELMDRNRLELLFDRHNKLVSQLNHEKSLIIGRKGSGKTTLLASVRLLDQDAAFFYLPPSDLFAHIVREINSLSDGVVFVEQVSRLWDFVLWGVVFKYVADKFNDKDIGSFCYNLRLENEDTPYEIITKMLSSMKKFPPEDLPLPEKIEYKKIGHLSFLQAKKIATDVLKKEKKRVYVLMDSLEDFKLDIPSYSTAVSGLLRCLGEFNESPKTSVVLRCCLPTERYFDYIALSTNPLRDFRNAMLLHWSAGELIHLSAFRYSKFLEEYFPIFYNGEVRKLDFKKRDDLEKFWNLIFPNLVRTRLNVEEKPIAYVLRHTQLLPRHFIFLLNEIISRSLKENNKAYDIDSAHIRTGVFEAEQRINEQIIEAYRNLAKDPKRAAAATLKELNTSFTWSEFDKVASRVTKMGIAGASDRTELMSLLTEIGAVGRVVGESKIYRQGVFEYMVPHKLIFSERDHFCVHPVFTEVCHVNIEYNGVKPIYTYWSGITDSDLEHWM